jgi:hypothetical protein
MCSHAWVFKWARIEQKQVPEIIGDKREDHRIIVIELKIVQVYQCVDDIFGIRSKVSEEVSVIVS